MPKAEHLNVFICRWGKTRSGYEFKVDSVPGLQVTGSTFEEAEAELLDLIGDKTGILTPGVEYLPPPPKSAILARFKGPGIVKINGNEVADLFPDFSYLFTGGICGSCKRGRGERTQLPLRFDIQGARGADGIFVRFQQRGIYGAMSLSVFSERFLNSLTKKEMASLEWIPVEVTNKSKTKYFEPVSKPLASDVRPAGLFKETERLQEDGFFCEECGRTELVGLPQGAGGISTFVSGSALPKKLPSCFQVGQTSALDFCMLESRWQQLLGKTGLKGLVSSPVGVLKENQICKTPVIEKLPRQNNTSSS